MAVRILEGDALQVLQTLPDCSVQCCVTSPPYFGLRDYGTAKWDGGDPDCKHRGAVGRTVSGGQGKQYTNEGGNRVFSGDCECGAIRADRQMGLEKTPDLYVDAMVGVFREVKRVLRDNGTLWLNIGDSYAASTKGSGGVTNSTLNAKRDQNGHLANDRKSQPAMESGPRRFDLQSAHLKQKDLIGIPWLLAFALRADGWYLRSDIIWAKPNPMPESVTDRPTKSHEYLFLLSKNERYYYDADAIAEDAIHAGRVIDYTGEQKANGADPNLQRTLPRGRSITVASRRNRRTVWSVTTSPYSEAHFATFPPKLIEPCILAGSAKQACEKCGAPWRSDVVASGGTIGKSWHDHEDDLSRGQRGGDDQNVAADGWKTYRRELRGYVPTCDCENSGTGKSLVLDPFGGAGTTGLVADRLGRDALLIELNPKYAEMARRRIHSDNPLFGDVA